MNPLSAAVPIRHGSVPRENATDFRRDTVKFSAQLAELLRRIHFVAGMFVGPFMLVAALSGALYAIAPTLEDVAYHQQKTVEAVSDPIPLADQISAAHREHPDLEIGEVWPADSSTDSTRVLLTDPQTPDANPLAVFINPGNGEVLGAYSSNSGLGELPLRFWISQLHKNLHLGETGEIYSETAASWLWVLALGGLWLWWRRVRTAKARLEKGNAEKTPAASVSAATAAKSTGRATGKAESTGKTEVAGETGETKRARPSMWRGVPAEKGSRRAMLNGHAVVGVWLIVVLLGLSATGITWSRFAGANVSSIAESQDWKTAPMNLELDSSSGSGAGAKDPAEIADEAATVVASAKNNGLTGPLRMYVPEDASSAWKVSERWVPWRTTADQVGIDGRDGTLVDEIRFSDLSLFSKLTSWGIYLHMGIMFGLPLQLMLLVAALGIALIVVQGYRMWWRRGAGAMLRQRWPGRGLVRWRAHLLMMVLALVVGQLLPLLGISLAAFLVVDVVFNQWNARRARSRKRPRGGAGRSDRDKKSDRKDQADREGEPLEVEVLPDRSGLRAGLPVD